MWEEDTEQPQRRRSARIIALEEKKEREKKALASARKSNPENNNASGNKGKGKAIVDEDYDFTDDSDEEDDEQYAPSSRKRGRKRKALHQLISSTQPMQGGQNPENRSASRRNGSPRMPEKHVLEFVLDLLQRKDPEELFSEPVNPEEVQDYYRVVKQPMDFGTMRAKLHENMYTSMEQFKRDVYLMCTNAMNVNPATSIYHKVAEAIGDHATKVFHGLSADPEHFDSEFSLNKRLRGRKPQVQPRTSGRAKQLPHIPDEGNNGTYPMVPELERRRMYWPPSDESLLSEVINGPQPNFQLNKPACNYQDSVLRFVKDLGPVAKTVANKRLESLQLGKLWNGETLRTNPLANFLDAPQINTPTSTTTTTGLPSEALAQPQAQSPNNNAHNMHYYSRALSLSNSPLTIPGPAVQEESRNTINIGVNNMRDGAYKGKTVCVNEGWDACAAALLGNVFLNYDKWGSSSSELKGESSNNNASGIIDKMVFSPVDQNVSSLLGSFHEEATNQNQEPHMLGATSNLTENIDHQWNSATGTSNLIDNFIRTTRNITPRSSRVRSQVWPTRVISGPQPKPLDHMTTNNRLSSELSFLAQPRPSESVSAMNHPGLSDLSQPRPPESMSGYNLLGQSLLSQLKPAEPEIGNCLLGQSLLSHLKPAEPITENIPPGQSLFSQLKQAEPMTVNSLLGQSLLSQLKPEHMTNNSFFGQSLLSQPTPAEPVTGYNLSGQSLLSHVKPTEPMTGNGNSLLGQSLLPLLKPAESMYENNFSSGQFIMPSQAVNSAKWNELDTSFYGLSSPYQPGDFQALLGSSNFNNVAYPSHDQVLNQAYGYSDLPMQPSQLNPLGLFSQQEPKSSSSALEMPLGDATNYYGGSTALEGQLGEPTAQLLWDDDQQPNLALQL